MVFSELAWNLCQARRVIGLTFWLVLNILVDCA